MRFPMLALLALSGCAVDTPEAPAPGSGTSELPPACPAPAGKLTIYAIPPPVSLDWSTPNQLLGSVIASRSAAANLVKAGEAAMTHSIGHVNVELDCGDLSIPLTGQTDVGGGEWRAASDGAGLLLRDSEGVMDAMPDGDPAETIADIAARQQYGHVTRISFVVNHAMCERLRSFVDAYEASGAYKHYDGAFRARRMEGAGCAIFGAGVIDVGGLLRRSLFTPEWARSEMIGSARIADFLGTGRYRYGGNLVARDEQGTHWLWPAGQDVPASTTTPVVIYSSVLDAWSGSEDLPFDVPGLTGAMTTRLPFTIYDPQLMSEWGERVWLDATDHDTALAFDVPWTASTVDHAHEVTYDAHCVTPQTIPFEADHDDLFEDSDAGAD
ncbi:MAG TPA: hypothetical protein VLB44_08010 [Kofleriaceae bacterium]|nr:hypothetical protein [Kofleriaceae bacterium]